MNGQRPPTSQGLVIALAVTLIAIVGLRIAISAPPPSEPVANPIESAALAAFISRTLGSREALRIEVTVQGCILTIVHHFADSCDIGSSGALNRAEIASLRELSYAHQNLSVVRNAGGHDEVRWLFNQQTDGRNFDVLSLRRELEAGTAEAGVDPQARILAIGDQLARRLDTLEIVSRKTTALCGGQSLTEPWDPGVVMLANRRGGETLTERIIDYGNAYCRP